MIFQMMMISEIPNKKAGIRGGLMKNKFMQYEFWEDRILEASDGDVGLWQILSEVRSIFPKANEQERKVITLEIVREYLNSGFIELAMLEYNNDNKLEFKICDLDIDSAIHRIDREWSELGTEPSIGDIAYLITTDKGDQEADRISQRTKEHSESD